MRSLLLAIKVSALLITATSTVDAQPQWPEVNNETKAGSRWWWLGSAVNEENLKWNISQYAQAGIGTLEITPIYGVKGNAANNIKFMSSQWLDMLKYAVEQGRQQGIDIDMTTGTGWPFGGPMVKSAESASKLVTEETKLTGDGSKELTMTLTNSVSQLQRVLAYPQKGNDGTVKDLTQMLDGKKVKWTAPAGDWRIIAVFCQPGVMQVKRPSPGSEGLVLDYFDAEAVASYLEWFDKEFEKGTDIRPRSFFNDSYEISAADWTRNIFSEFEKYRGYKLEDVMDKLIDKDQQVLADYRQTLSDMLLHNFTEQWTAWAHRHGATTRNQAHGSPGNLIDLYAASDIPETESFYLSDFGIKGLRADPGFTMTALSSLPTLKYASSAAHITGKRLTSSESMTWLTENFRSSLSQMKPEIDQLFVAGVNRVLFHGTTYSPSEAAWPGWKFYAAVDMSPTNSIWRDAPYLMKYIERVQSFLQMGQPDNDFLVYAPFSHVMHKNTGDFTNRMVQFDINHMDSRMGELAKCTNTILAAGYDCDYTSERYLMTTRYADGLLQTEGGTKYQALVVPLSNNMPDSVKVHLNELAAAGAKIVYDYSAETLAALSVANEPLRADLGLKVIRRRNATGYHYFIANLSPDDVEGYVSLAVPFNSIAVFDPMTGDIANASLADGQVYISLKSGQSVILQTYNTAVDAGRQQEPVKEMAALRLDGKWQLSFTDDSYPQMAGRTYDMDGVSTWENLDEQTAQLMGTGIYETTFHVTSGQIKSATGGFRLDLGDVRESARVWLNGEYLGCAWSVPFVVNCNHLVHEGSNTLKIEVTNLPANRIRQWDVNGTEWRIFEDANISSISNSTTYASWSLVPSGLNSSVRLVPLALNETAMAVRQKAMKQSGDGGYIPVYELSALNGQAIKGIEATDAKGHSFTGVSTVIGDDGIAELSVSGTSPSNIIVKATDVSGNSYYAYLPAYGTYRQKFLIDFTSMNEPLDGWQKLSGSAVIKGFDGTGALERYRSKSNGKSVKLYDGVTFNSTKSNYYFFYPGYGMNTNNDFEAEIEVEQGDIVCLSYLVGSDACVYQASDSLVSFCLADGEKACVALPMPGNSSYYVYRTLSLFTPQETVDILPVNKLPGNSTANNYFTLQGQRISKPRSGIYIKNRKKVIIN